MTLILPKILTLFSVVFRERRIMFKALFIVVCPICVVSVGFIAIRSSRLFASPLGHKLLRNIGTASKIAIPPCTPELNKTSDAFNATLSGGDMLRNKASTKKALNTSRNRPLFQLHPLGVRNKNIVPDICVALLSCRRIHHLQRTIPAIIRYFAKIEPNVSYEIALLDNGSDRDTVNEILNDYPIDIIVLRQENVGIAEGIDTLFHGACRSPFILSLEDDWEARVETWSVDVPVMAMSMHVLRSDPVILEIWLRDWDNGLPAHRNRTEWLQAPADSSVMNGQQILYRRLARTPGSVWGGYTNGASLKHRERVRSVGYMKVHSNKTIVDFNGEYRYAVRVLDAGYVSAHLCLPMWHLKLRCDLVPKSKEPYVMPGLFMHIGKSGRSPGHQDFHGIETIPQE